MDAKDSQKSLSFHSIERALLRANSNTILIAVLLWVLNAIIVFPLFSGGYTQFSGSIEPAFLTDARFIASNFPNIGWDPLWYGGFPFHLAYPPLVPFLVAIINQSSFGLISIASAYRILIGLAYSLTPTLLYLFVFYLTKKHSAGILAAAFYSLIPAYLPTQQFPTAPVNLTILTSYGEGPHIVGLALFPVCSILFLRTLRQPTYRNYLLASLSIALAFLTDLVAAFALAAILAVLFSSEMIRGNYHGKIKTTLVCAVLSGGLVAFWYNLSFIDASIEFGGGSGTIGLALLVITGSICLYFAILRRKRESLNGFIAFSWTTIFALFIALYFLFHLTVAPQPLRYVPELLMGLAILVGLGASSLFETLSTHFEINAIRRVSIVAILCALILVSLFILPPSWHITTSNSDFVQGPEYQTAEWLANHDSAGARVFATGSEAFWLNVFSNVPQLRGGSDQAVVNIKWWQPVTYLILGGGEANLSILWMQALDIQYVVVNSQSAPLPYHDYLNSSEFQGLLPLRYLSNGTYIYEVPLANPQLATVVNNTALESIGTVSSLYDSGRLSNYVRVLSAIQNPITLQDPNPDTMIIKAFIQNSSQGIVVKMNYNQAWHATLDGHSISTQPDPVGFMLVKPESVGNVTIVLSYISVTNDVLAGYIITLATIVAVTALVLESKISSRHLVAKTNVH